MKTLFTTIIFIAVNILEAQSPILISNEGKYLGDLNDNPYDPSSVSNPYGIYGSPYSPDSVNNPYGRNGSTYSVDSPNNAFSSGRAPIIYSPDGDYLGRLSKNVADPDSVSNPYGAYGSPYIPSSINNHFGKNGSPFSQKSATFIYGAPFFKEQDAKHGEDTLVEPELISHSQKKNGEDTPTEPGLILLLARQKSGGMFEEYLIEFTERLKVEFEKTQSLKRIRDKIKTDIRNKEQEKVQKEKEVQFLLLGKEAFGTGVYYNKEYMLELYKNGLVEELKNYCGDEATYSGFTKEEQLIAEKYIDKRTRNIKKVLLSEF
jgi:hypothetical protein